MTYHPRIVDRELADRLQATGAVVIEGPRACGKTTTARQIAASEVRLDVDQVARRLASLEPARVLVGDVPRLIDEWQLEPAIWNQCEGRWTIGASRASSSLPDPRCRRTTRPATRGQAD